MDIDKQQCLIDLVLAIFSPLDKHYPLAGTLNCTGLHIERKMNSLQSMQQLHVTFDRVVTRILCAISQVFQSCMWTFVRHTVSRCLTFPALMEVTWSRGQVLANNTRSFPPVPVFGSIWVVLWLLFFRSAPSTFQQWRGYLSWSLFLGVPSH